MEVKKCQDSMQVLRETGGATRQGSKDSGIQGHIRGWNIGVYTVCYIGEDGKDHVRVSITGGSANPSTKKVLGDFVE